MRGLWKKDYYLGRQYLLLGAVISLLLIFMAYWIRLAYIYGNLALLPEEDRLDNLAGLDMIFPVLPGVVLLFMAVKAVNVSIYADRQAGWNRYLLSSPLGEKVIVRAKYLEFLGAEGAALTIGLLAAGIYGLFFGFYRVKIGCLGLAVALLVALLCESIMLPLSYRYQSENVAVAAAFLGTMLPGFLVLTLLMLANPNPEQTLQSLGNWCRTHPWVILFTALGIATLALAVSYGITLRIVGKRKWCE